MPETRKLNLRLPPTLADQAQALAQAQGISLNAFLTLGVRNWVGYQQRGMREPAGDHPTTAKASTAHTVGRGTVPKVGRNDPCPCGSGRKWKVCHGQA